MFAQRKMCICSDDRSAVSVLFFFSYESLHNYVEEKERQNLENRRKVKFTALEASKSS